MVFASSTARTTALSGVLAEGMMSYLQDTNAVEVYNGTSWVNVGNAGDITEVQAGVGISIASGTGPIPVITNSSTDLITTAGDLLYGTAADTMARLGIGTAGQVLKVNSGATAPEWAVDPTTDVVTTAGDLIYATGADAVTRLGIGTAGQVLKVNSGATAPEWGAASSASTFVGCAVYATAATISISNTTETKVAFDAEFYDTDGFHSNVTNNTRLTVPSGKAGKYQVWGWCEFAGNTTGYRQVQIWRNNNTGTPARPAKASQAGTTAVNGIYAAGIIDLAVGDYVEFVVYQNSGGALNIFGTANDMQFGLAYLGA